MPKSLYNSTIEALCKAGAVQSIYLNVSPVSGDAIKIDPANDIVQGSLSVDRYCVTGNTVELGSACAAELTFKLYNHDGRFDSAVFAGAEISLILLLNEKDGIYGTMLPFGYFTVDEAPRKTQIITIKALDRMVQFNKIYNLDLSYPVTVETLARAICSAVNVPYNDTINTTAMQYMGEVSVPACPNVVYERDYTYRDYLYWIGEVIGACSYIDAYGKLCFATYADFSGVTPELTPDMRMDNGADLYEEDVVITGIQLTRDDGEILTIGSSGYMLNIENNQILNQYTVAQANYCLSTIYARWGGLTYRPFSASTLSVPYLWPLDKINYVTLDGNIISTIVTHSTFVLNGNSQIQAKGKTSLQSGYAQSDALTKRERLIIDTLKKQTAIKLSDIEQATIQLNAMMINSMGMYSTEIDDGAGGTIIYGHDAASLEASNFIYTKNSNGFAWTTSGWNDGEPVWTYGVDKNGCAVLAAIAAYKISADYIQAGTIVSQTGGTSINLNNGSFSFAGGKLSWSPSTNVLSVTGKITAMSGSIGGWNIGSNYMSYDGDGYGMGFWPQRVNTSGNVISVWYDSTEKFKVTGEGKLYATDAEITGKITATSGSIGGWTVNSTQLSYSGSSYSVGIFPRKINTASDVIYIGTQATRNFAVTGLGVMYCTEAHITGGNVILTGEVAKVTFSDQGLSFTDISNGYEYAHIAYDSLQVALPSSSAGTYPVYVDGSGTFYKITSSKKYKRAISSDITAFCPEGLLDLKIKQYKYKKGHFKNDPDNDEMFCGFIAEDVAKHYPHAAKTNKKGEVEMWDVYRIVPPMLDLIQKLYKRVETLEGRIL